MPLNAMVNVVTTTSAGMLTFVWKYVKSPYARQPMGARQTRDGMLKLMMSPSGADPHPGSLTAGMVATSYSQGSPCCEGLQLKGTSPSGLLGVTSRPSCICHGVRV